jgi:hypothetical protein
MFNTGLNITPEHAIDHGAIIVLDFPIEIYSEVGRLAQAIFRYAFQKAVLRRVPTKNSRNCFLAVDEASLHLSPYDAEFLSLSRESRCASIFCVQNLPSIYARIGGSNPRDTADQFIGNFFTFVFHANGDFRTNEAAANMIGKGIQRLYNQNVGGNSGAGIAAQHGESISKSGMPGSVATYSSSSSVTRNVNVGQSWGGGFSEYIDYDLQPQVFTRLRTGSKQNKHLVDAIVFRPGSIFRHSGKTWLHTVLSQR